MLRSLTFACFTKKPPIVNLRGKEINEKLRMMEEGRQLSRNSVYEYECPEFFEKLF